MIDKVEIHITSGAGGDGALHFRREKFVDHGGPDGGDGGRGGHIILIADTQIDTLTHLSHRYKIVAEKGDGGQGNTRKGAMGSDSEIRIPVGVEVWEDLPDGERSLMADVVSSGQRIIVAWGGRGGRGNKRFVSPTNQVPLLAEKGEKGQTRILVLQLKLLADVGIVGKPSAGKSTLLSQITAATPKVAQYPFTTTEPVLGVAEVSDHTFVAVEVPGLIENAHKGVGLGYEFLRHAERTRILVHLLDGSSGDIGEDFDKVNRELTLYSSALASKQQVLVVNKVDLPFVREKVSLLREKLIEKGLPIFFISAVNGEGIEPLLAEVVGMLKENPSSYITEDRPLVQETPRPRPAKIQVCREGDTFVVTSIRAERLMALVNITDWAVRVQLRRELERLGIVKALEEAGVVAGDKVRFSSMRTEMEWF
jgi:GTP-binding protein